MTDRVNLTTSIPLYRYGKEEEYTVKKTVKFNRPMQSVKQHDTRVSRGFG